MCVCVWGIAVKQKPKDIRARKDYSSAIWGHKAGRNTKYRTSLTGSRGCSAPYGLFAQNLIVDS